MTVSVTSERILQLINATSVILKGTSPQQNVDSCPNCGNTDPKTVDVVKRTCGYLGNPQARPMVKGRHKEISARVKHMNGSTIKYEGKHL